MREVFRPWFGRALFVAIAALCVVAQVGLVVRFGWQGVWPAAPWLALVAGSCWAVFWRPEVVVDDGGVRLVNVLRTIDVPWPAIRAVDTKWALTLLTAYGRFTGWAAPAPGIHEAMRATRCETEQLPPAAATADGIRPGDLPSSPSGHAAMAIRRRWQELREAGWLDEPRLEHARAPVRWHRATIVGGALLLGAALAGLVWS